MAKGELTACGNGSGEHSAAAWMHRASRSGTTGLSATALSCFASGEASAGIKSDIVQTTLDSVLARPLDHPLAVIVAGSMARDEQTILLRDGFAEVLGDAEFYLVFGRPAFAHAFQVLANSLTKEIEHRLAQSGIRCSVSLALPTTSRLRRMSPHIMGYELRRTGRVAWGDAEILNLIPNFSPADISKWDAWRSVSNRMIEQLGQAGPAGTAPCEGLHQLLYRCLKTQLELATLVTHFHGAFRPTYWERCEMIFQLQARSVPASSLPWWNDLAERVETATQFKLGKDDASIYAKVLSGQCTGEEAGVMVRKECEAVLSLVRSVWRWGAEQLLKRTLDDCADPLRTGLAIARAQSWRWRARGWAHLLFLEPKGSELRSWSQFFQLGSLGGPRFLAYAVAAALYFSWPDWMRGDFRLVDSVATRAAAYFPIPGYFTSAKVEWLEASRAVFAGWQKHLQENWA